MADLCTKYRPKRLKRVVGQDKVVELLQKKLRLKKVPRAILFYGPPGCGKTTLGRALARELGINTNVDGMNYEEVNSADFRGIDTIRDIRQRMHLKAIGNEPGRVWLIDECHKLSNDAQNAMLKMLEEPPKNVWFILATTEPEKLIAPIKQRCEKIKVELINPAVLTELVSRVAEKEGIELSKRVLKKLVEVAEGSARNALRCLERISDLEDEEAQLEAVEATDIQRYGIDLARALVPYKRTPWKEVATILRKLVDDPEGARRVVLGYMTTIMLNNGDARAALIMDRFREPIFQTGNAGFSVLCLCAWEALNAK